MDDKFLNFDFLTQEVTASKRMTIDDKCNAWTVINLGTSILRVNGIPLHPGTAGVNNGESFSSGGNRGELFKGKVQLTFAGNAGNAVFIQKVYTNCK